MQLKKAEGREGVCRMRVENFVEALEADFFAGVPDSLLKPLSSYLMDNYGTDAQHHVIAANEGNAVAVAAGYYLATGRVPVVYMQNSGEGNIVNPAASLLHRKVYGIPEIFVIGWRGGPGQKDEPQHVFQGEITLQLLDVLEIPYMVLGKETELTELRRCMADFRHVLQQGGSVALVVKKGALEYEGKLKYANSYTLLREEIIRQIIAVSGNAPIVSTTGKASRELFELREQQGGAVREEMLHGRDFLTVGSMGHSSSIALGIAMQKPEQDIWCVDGDGALLMHMGAMAVIGKAHPDNLIHVVINNEAHESVGGMPTAGNKADFAAIARGCGYDEAVSVRDMRSLQEVLQRYAVAKGLRFVEVRSAIGARSDLGRPTSTARDNKKHFMAYIAVCK